MVITPLLYQVVAEEKDLPLLARDVADRLSHVAEAFDSRLAVGRLDALPRIERLSQALKPFPMEMALRYPLAIASDTPDDEIVPTYAGVVTLESEQVLELLDGAELLKDAPDDGGPWWDFLRLESGGYALFPGDPESELRVWVTGLVRVDDGVQLRRLATGVSFDGGGFSGTVAETIVRDKCVHDVRGVEPGAPYRGSCVNRGCIGRCTPRAYVSPDDGIYRLRGCNC